MVSSKILMSENSEMEQRGDHRMQCMWSPLWSWPPVQKLKNVVSWWINACSHERKQFCLESDGFEQDFDEWKFWNGAKGGPQDAMHVVPPLVLTTSSKIEKLVFQMKKCLFWWKETVLFRIWNGAKGGPQDAMHVVPPLVLTTSSKIEKVVFQMKKCLFWWKETVLFRIGWFRARKQRGDHRMQCMWSPLWSWPQVQKLKNLFFRWKNACSDERKQFCLESDGFEQDFDEWKFWNGAKGKGGPQDAMYVVPPLVLTTSSKIEKLCL